MRWLLVNAVYWTLGLDDKISPESDVSVVVEYKPRPFGFGGAAKGVMPEAHRPH